jgi:hypothetical protein
MALSISSAQRLARLLTWKRPFEYATISIAYVITPLLKNG